MTARHSGPTGSKGATARSPRGTSPPVTRTGEFLSTVKFTVQTLAVTGELQRDLQRELTHDGLRAAEAKGSKGGRRPAVIAGKTAAVGAAYLEGRSSPPSLAKRRQPRRHPHGRR
ncbi:hypothetical protein [Streptomyces lanatus]|uniref:Resolvase/invertase-type recombinase catalytic domain-containing protein n=1 Tax=Streptomyces lanatus TaxID=66900 RepID=A0ABV1Y239_9ACTN|nr:hypothetical protein [Streptomyces lanatus]GHH25676.1 hypothetical protein GCM10018780_77930 [Streptomyces lanatus]